MFSWQRHITDSAGNVVTDATVEVRDADTSALVSIFSDLAGTTPKSNPFLVDSEGFALFYAAAGLYNITAQRAGLERIYSDVLLGVRVADVPNLTSLVVPIAEPLIEAALESIATAIAELPDLVRFAVLGTGVAQGAIPADWTAERTALGRYRITHGLSTTNYHPKLTVWDPATDRVYSAMLIAKEINYFEYQVRSIHDEASASDSRVDVEVTIS